MRECIGILVLILFTSPIAAFGEEAAFCAPGDNKDDCKGGLDRHACVEKSDDLREPNLTGLSEMKFAHQLARFANGTPLCGWTGVTCDANNRVSLL